MTFEPRFEPLVFDELRPEEMEARSAAFYVAMKRRRTIRDFSPRPVPVEVIRNAVLAAATAPSGANEPFLEIAPYLIVIFLKRTFIDEDGRERKTYYPVELVGIATGMLIAALQLSGLATLTYTASPMRLPQPPPWPARI